MIIFPMSAETADRKEKKFGTSYVTLEVESEKTDCCLDLPSSTYKLTHSYTIACRYITADKRRVATQKAGVNAAYESSICFSSFIITCAFKLLSDIGIYGTNFPSFPSNTFVSGAYGPSFAD